MSSERRSVDRRKIFQAASVHWKDGSKKQMLCIVTDLTERGAQVELFGINDLPPRVRLHVGKVNQSYDGAN